jgi:hypothetical protein
MMRTITAGVRQYVMLIWLNIFFDCCNVGFRAVGFGFDCADMAHQTPIAQSLANPMRTFVVAAIRIIE